MDAIEIRVNEPAPEIEYDPSGKTRTDNPYFFDLDQFGFPTFTEKNLAFVSALIKNDSNYNGEDSEIAQAYKEPFSNDGDNDNNLELVVRDIDKVNTTHLAAEGPQGGNGGIEKAAERVKRIPNLHKRLLEKDDSLIKDIGKTEQKNNFSFATKFCAYACLRSEAIKRDNYCIFDTVVADVLPYYVYMYANDTESTLLRSCCSPLTRGPRKGTIVSRVEKWAKKTETDCSDGANVGYPYYRELVDAVLEGIKKKLHLSIEYKQFDDLVWYYFKGKIGAQRREKAFQKIQLP